METNIKNPMVIIPLRMIIIRILVLFENLIVSNFLINEIKNFHLEPSFWLRKIAAEQLNF